MNLSTLDNLHINTKQHSCLKKVAIHLCETKTKTKKVTHVLDTIWN